MNWFFRWFDRFEFKNDARRLGINVLTATMVGGFITHATDMNRMMFWMLIWSGFMGFGFVLFGLYRGEK